MSLQQAEWHAPSVEDLPIKRCQKLGLVVTVKSEVLGESVVFAPTAVVDGETRVVYTWREAFIMAKAKPEVGALQYLHEFKKQFPGSVVESITLGSDNGTGVKMSGAAMGNEPQATKGLEGAGYWQRQDQARARNLEHLKGPVPHNNHPKEKSVKTAPSQQVPPQEVHTTPLPVSAEPTTDACLVVDQQLLSGRSLESLLPRRPSQATGK